MLKLEDLKTWEDAKNQVLCCDCLDYMKMMPDKCVDLVLTDPPYELNNSGTNSFLSPTIKKITEGLKDIKDGFDEIIWFEEIKRIQKKVNCFIFCSNKQITKIMNLGEKNGYLTTLLIWHKSNSTPFCFNVWRGDCEYCVHIRESGAYFEGNAQLKKKVTTLPMNTDTFHPTVKPISLINKYLKIGSKENDTIFDPFMGSWTTARACKDLGRNFIGCEISEKYCSIGEDRLRQQNLF